MLLKLIAIIILLTYNYYRARKKVEKIICRKPNEFWHVIAAPGGGKTTLAAMLVDKGRRESKKVYSTVPIRGAIKFDLKDLGKIDISDAILIIDEGGSSLNNRNWQHNLTKEANEFIRKHRHYNVDIYVFSQSPTDIDNKFRDLVTIKYLLQKKSAFVCEAIALKKVMKLESGQIVEYLEVDEENNFKFFVPKYWAYFNSWDRKMQLKAKKDEYYTILDL